MKSNSNNDNSDENDNDDNDGNMMKFEVFHDIQNNSLTCAHLVLGG